MIPEWCKETAEELGCADVYRAAAIIAKHAPSKLQASCDTEFMKLVNELVEAARWYIDATAGIQEDEDELSRALGGIAPAAVRRLRRALEPFNE